MATVSRDPLVDNWEMPTLLDLVEDDGRPAPEPLTVSFVEWMRMQVAYYRSLGHDAGDFLANAIQEKADLASMLGAKGPAEYEARLEVIEPDDNPGEEAYAAGFDAAYRYLGIPRF